MRHSGLCDRGALAVGVSTWDRLERMMDVDESKLYSQLPALLKNCLTLPQLADLVMLILGKTSSYKSCKVVIDSPEALASLLYWVHSGFTDVEKDACRALINISSYKEGCAALLSSSLEDIYQNVAGKRLRVAADTFALLTDAPVNMAELLCCLLNNLTRSAECAAQVADALLEDDSLCAKFLASADEKLARLEHMPFLYGNLAQDTRIRKLLLDHNANYFEVFPPLLKEETSSVHHSGIICLIKNCCFEYDKHEWLLGPEVDLLSYLLWPLAGPEEFDMEDTEKLPIGLQYLPIDKTREPKTAVRRMVLEAVYKLCARKLTREILRAKNAYVILREYEKWEEDLELSDMVSVVVNLLIQTEDEIGADFLPGLNIPEEIKTKFENTSCQQESAANEEVQLIS
ncbi:protein HGH1 homolog isoform X2 [Bacillus rossius redtenbacheri]|uniref:protein HGH1 homolog isoform X2 n=1 Tax=Bacillus rossius redtenbacheri TaxID=93214 RepID=UPI002FDED261